MTWRRSAMTCLALLTTLSATPAGAQAPLLARTPAHAGAAAVARPDTIPGPDAGLGALLEAGAAGVYRWPRARGELAEILARGARQRAAIRDTVSALNARAATAGAEAKAHADSLASDLRYANLDLEHERELRGGWLLRTWESADAWVGMFIGSLITLLMVRVTVGG